MLDFNVLEINFEKSIIKKLLEQDYEKYCDLLNNLNQVVDVDYLKIEDELNEF